MCRHSRAMSTTTGHAHSSWTYYDRTSPQGISLQGTVSQDTYSQDTHPRGMILVRGLVKTYEREGVVVPALKGIDLEIAAGDQVALMGPSGSGKSTMLHCLAGIVRATSGSICISGVEVASLSEGASSERRLRSYGCVFQDGQLLPELPCEENVALPLMLLGTRRSEAVMRARTMLAQLGCDGLGAFRPGQLSGGQAQRVAIARALITSPEIIFADEPTGALDQTTGAEVMSVLTQACAHSEATLVLVTHDLAIAQRLRRIVGLRDGRIDYDSDVPTTDASHTQAGTR